MDSIKTADEIIASVDATLASWRSAFESSPKKGRGRTNNANADRPSPSSSPINEAKSPQQPWEDPDEYHRRLSTFKPTTYFAKPLALSPLVCAAFGWENTGKDIIKCRHPKCGATICVAFHPSLSEDSHDGLCQKYLNMLVSSHTCGCPFRSFASRWSKVMHQRSSRGGDCDKKTKHTDHIIVKENNAEHLMSKVSEGLNDSKTNFYVPPYFLSLSDEFLRFEDCTFDGSITRDCVKEGATRVRDKLQASNMGDSVVEVVVPDAVTNFVHELLPDADLDDVLFKKEGALKAPYLMSTFGWSICDESAGENTGMTVKCNMCQARTWLAQSSSVDEAPSSRKRRRINLRDDANLKLIDSHRVYCPYVSGFSFGPRQQSELPGWKLVVSNLLKTATQCSVE